MAHSFVSTDWRTYTVKCTKGEAEADAFVLLLVIDEDEAMGGEVDATLLVSLHGHVIPDIVKVQHRGVTEEDDTARKARDQHKKTGTASYTYVKVLWVPTQSVT